MRLDMVNLVNFLCYLKVLFKVRKREESIHSFKDLFIQDVFSRFLCLGGTYSVIDRMLFNKLIICINYFVLVNNFFNDVSDLFENLVFFYEILYYLVGRRFKITNFFFKVKRKRITTKYLRFVFVSNLNDSGFIYLYFKYCSFLRSLFCEIVGNYPYLGKNFFSIKFFMSCFRVSFFYLYYFYYYFVRDDFMLSSFGFGGNYFFVDFLFYSSDKNKDYKNIFHFYTYFIKNSIEGVNNEKA